MIGSINMEEFQKIMEAKAQEKAANAEAQPETEVEENSEAAPETEDAATPETADEKPAETPAESSEKNSPKMESFFIFSNLAKFSKKILTNSVAYVKI